jgi:hypothetical protein
VQLFKYLVVMEKTKYLEPHFSRTITALASFCLHKHTSTLAGPPRPKGKEAALIDKGSVDLQTVSGGVDLYPNKS